LIPGRHNIENAVAAISMVSFMSEDENKIKSAFLNYKGVKRRFEVIYKSDDTLYVDDYAHHPTEIRVTLETLKELHHNKKLIAIFQPHLFSRTKDLAAEFGQSLSLADEVILLPIYPARELPMEGVSSQLILDNVSTLSKSIKSKEEIIDYLKNNQIEILCTLGAGDIDQMVQPILSLLKQNKNEKN
jgi:UDP-N-acetylmuramate--alanine ligase